MSYLDREWYRNDVRANTKRKKHKRTFKRVALGTIKWVLIAYLAAGLICAYRVQNAFSIALYPLYSITIERVVNSWIVGYLPRPITMVEHLLYTDDELIEMANGNLADMFLP
jgi:hypothetical protein